MWWKSRTRESLVVVGCLGAILGAGSVSAVTAQEVRSSRAEALIRRADSLLAAGLADLTRNGRLLIYEQADLDRVLASLDPSFSGGGQETPPAGTDHPPPPTGPPQVALPVGASQQQVPVSVGHPTPPTTPPSVRMPGEAVWGDLPEPGPEEREVLQDLIRRLRTGNEMDREMAAVELGFHGASGREAIPVLVQALLDPAPSVRAGAALGIQGIGLVGMVGETAPSLLRSLSDSAPAVRAEAARALSAIGPLGSFESGAVQSLRAALIDPDVRVREAARESLTLLGY